MRAEQGEQAGPGGRALRPAMAHTGGVVEHHHPGRHAHALEDPQQTLAHALRDLAGKGDHPTHVRIRERHHQETHHAFHSGDHGPGPAEIDLHAARRPLQLGEAVRLHATLPPPALDPTPHRRIRAREPALRHEPLVHARRGMTLLDGQAQIRGRPPVHDGRIPVIDQRPARMPRAKGLGRAIPVAGVLDHGRARYAEFPRYLPVAQALAVELPDTPSDTPVSSFPFLPRTTSLVDRHSGIHQGTGRCRCSHSTGAITADTVQIERSGCSGTSADSEHLYSITHTCRPPPHPRSIPHRRGIGVGTTKKLLPCTRKEPMGETAICVSTWRNCWTRR